MKFSKLYGVLAVMVLAITLYLTWRAIEIEWVKLLKLDKVFVDYNSKGLPTGEVLDYKSGALRTRGNLINGIKQGWEVAYYKNGKIKSRTFFVNGLPAGRGYLYTSTGDVDYIGTYKFGGPYGGWYQFYSNGRIKKYTLYDIDKFSEDKSFTIGYGINGSFQLENMRGLVVSPNFYSIDPVSKVLIPLNYKEKPARKFNKIKDLFITVATPASANLLVKVTVNTKKYVFKNVKSSTIKISNVFLDRGRYNIFVESFLYNANQERINGVSIKDSLIKE